MYANDKSCGTLISTTGTFLTEELASEVNGKKYLSVTIDSATDAAGKENETVHCQFVKDGQPAKVQQTCKTATRTFSTEC